MRVRSGRIITRRASAAGGLSANFLRSPGNILWGSAITAGQWFGMPKGYSVTGQDNTVGRLFLVPFTLLDALTVSTIGTKVDTGGAGGIIRLGVYQSDTTTGLPTTTVGASVTVVADTTGVKTSAFARSFNAGLHYLAAMVEVATGITTGEVTHNHGGFLAKGIDSGDYFAAAGGRKYTAFEKSVATGSLPDLTGLSLTLTQVNPFVGLGK